LNKEELIKRSRDQAQAKEENPQLVKKVTKWRIRVTHKVKLDKKNPIMITLKLLKTSIQHIKS